MIQEIKLVVFITNKISSPNQMAHDGEMYNKSFLIKDVAFHRKLDLFILKEGVLVLKISSNNDCTLNKDPDTTLSIFLYLPFHTMAPQDNKITVKFYDAETKEEISSELEPDTEIQSIYDFFNENNVKTPETYYLAYNGQVLHKGWKIKETNISTGARIDICPRQFIKITFQGSNVTFNGAKEIGANISTDAFIGNLKDQFSLLINKKRQDIQIYWNNKELNDTSTLISLGISTDTTMTVTSKERITIIVKFLGNDFTLSFPISSTIQQFYDKCYEDCKDSLNNITVQGYTVTFNKKLLKPENKLSEIGITNMDVLEYEITISGGTSDLLHVMHLSS